MNQQELIRKLKQTLSGIRCRCENDRPGHKHYFGKGIKCILTLDDLLFLWNRDYAWELKRPSVDRIDSNGNYELSNCRYIELSCNAARTTNPDAEEYYLTFKDKEFYSQLQASRMLGCCITTIRNMLKRGEIQKVYRYQF